MSDFSISNNHIYNQPIDFNSQPQSIESDSKVSEIESAGEQITNECESKDTQSQSEHKVEKEKPLNSEANMKDLSDPTKKNLAKYLSKTCDMMVAGQSQDNNTANMQALIQGVTNNPLGKAALSDDLETKIADSLAQKSSGDLPGGERVQAAQHNLEAFSVIAQGGDSSLRATCAANSVAYLDSLVEAMPNANIDNDLQSTALPFLACEDPAESKDLQGKLEQAVADLKQAATSGTAQEQGLASVISDFVSDLIAQKNESLEVLSQASFKGLDADITDGKNLFSISTNEDGKPSLVSNGQEKINTLGAIANSQTDLLNTKFNNINHTAKTALDALENNNLEQAKSSISLLGTQNKEAQALVQNAFNERVQNQVDGQANKIVNHVLTPKSELKALKHAAKAQQAQGQAQDQNQVANKQNDQAKSIDINKFNSDHLDDLSTLYKNLSNLALPDSKKFNKIAVAVNQDNTQTGALSAQGAKKGGVLSVSPEVYNKAVSLIKDEVSKHEGFAAKQKEQLQNIDADIAKLKSQLDALDAKDKPVDLQAQNALDAEKAAINTKINDCHKMMATVLRDGLEGYVNNHVSGYDLAKSSLEDYGINKNNPLGYINGGVSGLFNEVNYDRIAQHSLSDKAKDAPEHMLRGVLDNLSISNQKQARANQAAQAKQANAANQGANAGQTNATNQGANANNPVPIDTNLVAKELLHSNGKEVLDNLHNSSDDKDKSKAFDEGRRLLLGFDAIESNFSSVAHTLAMGSNPTTNDPNNATTTNSQDPAVISANNEQARTEMEALFDLIRQDDNSALCDKVLTSAFAAKDDATLDNLSSLLHGLEKAYSDDSTQTNRITNAADLVDNMTMLAHNDFFNELGSATSVLNSVNNQGMNDLKDAYANFKSDPSSQNMLQLAMAIHKLKPEDIALDVASFRDEAQAQVQAQPQGKNAKATSGTNTPTQSVDEIAQRLCNEKTNQLKASLATLEEHGENLIDMAYDKFQLDNNIKLNSRAPSPENADFFANMRQACTTPEDEKYLNSFMSDGLVRGDGFTAKLINKTAKGLTKAAKLPSVRELVKNINPDLKMTEKRNVALNYFFDKFGTQEFKDNLANMPGSSISNKYDAMNKELSKLWGSDKNLVTLGLAQGLESNFNYEVDSKASTKNQSLTKAGVDEATAKNYLSADAFKKNEGETQAAAIRLAVSMVVDSDFTSCDLSGDLVSKYLSNNGPNGTNGTNSPNNNAQVDGMNNQERDLFLAMEEARKGNQWLADGSCLVRGLYKEYQASHNELNGVDFNSLDQDQYKDMLDHYYSKFGMSVPMELSICGPGNNSSAQAMTNADKAKALDCLQKAICDNKQFTTLDKAAKDALTANFQSASSILKQKGDLTAAQQDTLKNNFAAIYNQLSGDQDLLKVCDFVMMNKSVSNSLEKEKMTTDKTMDRMLSKIFDPGVLKSHKQPNELGRMVQSRFAFASVQENYIDSEQIKTKSNMIKKGETMLMNQVLADKQTSALVKTGVHMAMLDVAQLYGNESIIGFAASQMTGLVKSSIINSNQDDLTGANPLKANLEITPEQVETLREKGIDVNVVKLDSKGNEIIKNKDTGVQPSEANSDQIELKVVQNPDGTMNVALNDLLGAALATHINVDEHNNDVLQQAQDLNMPKDAAGNFLHKVPGVVTRQEIANGIMDFAARDADFTDDSFREQSRKQLHDRVHNKLDLVKEHYNNLVLSIKNGTSFSDDWSRVKARELQKREDTNVGLMADVLFSIDSNSALTFSNKKDFKLFSFEKKVDLDKAEANFSAELSVALKDGFCITKENGSYTFTVSKELAAKAGVSASIGVEAKKEDLPNNSSLTASAEASVEAEAEVQVGGAVSFEFANEQEAATFMHHLMLHNVDESALNRASLELYVGAEASAGIEVSAAMVFTTGEEEEEEDDEDEEKTTSIDGIIPQIKGTATEDLDTEVQLTEKKEDDSKSFGVEAQLNLSCTGQGSYSLINEPNHRGYKTHLAGSIVCSASGAAGNLSEDATAQVSFNKGATFQYDVTTEVRVERTSDKLSSSNRTETYQINYDNDLTTVLTMQGLPKEMIDSLLAAHQTNPITEISFNGSLKEGLALSPKDPALKNKANYDMSSVSIKFSEEITTDFKSFGYIQRTKTLNNEKSIEVKMEALLDKNNAKSIGKVLTKSA